MQLSYIGDITTQGRFELPISRDFQIVTEIWLK
jgi:hypothetical protein